MHRFSVVLACALPSAIVAQTYLVDANNGPGANFTSIATAVAAVPDGATLIVRPGTYAGFSIAGKGLTVLGEPGAQIVTSHPFWGVEIANTSPAQTVVFAGFEITAPRNSVLAHDCAGKLLLDDIVADLPAGPHVGGVGATVWVQFCDQVMLREIVGDPGRVWLYGSNTVLEACTVRGPSGYNAGFGQTSAPSSALTIEGGTTTVSACNLTGGAGIASWMTYPDQPAIELWAQVAIPDLRVLGGSNLIVVTPLSQSNVPAIAGTGTARIDPSVALVTMATPAIAATVQATTLVQPDLLGSSASPGGTLMAATSRPFGSLVILAIGLPGPPVAVPGVADPYWLDPAAYAFLAIGTPQLGVPLVASVAVPNNPAFRGLLLGWQATSFVQNALVTSNPSWTLVR